VKLPVGVEKVRDGKELFPTISLRSFFSLHFS
jgi:hypothetical protein